MTTHLICDATTWPTIANSPQRLKELLTWLRANGVNPDDIPTDTTTTVEPGSPEGPLVIRYEVYLRNEDGHKHLADPADEGKGAAREWRTTPLAVLPPGHWWIDPTPAEPTS